MSEKNYNWNDPIPAGDGENGDFFIFDDGDEVNFEVMGFEKAISTNNNPMAKLVLKLSDNEGNTAKAFESLVLCEKMAWKLYQFFVAIGQAEPGCKVINPRWNEVEGAKGRCKVEVDTYEKNGKSKRINRVAKWLEPNASPAVKAETEPKFEF